MKKQINDLLLKMQSGENCIGETASALFDLYNQRPQLPPEGFNILKYREPKDGQYCECITEVGRTFIAHYQKFLAFKGGVFVNNELDEGYRDKVIYWKDKEK